MTEMLRRYGRINYIKDPYTKLLFKHIWSEVNRWNFGYFGVSTGASGHGKSENSLLTAWFQDKTLTEDTLKQKYFFSAKEFIKNVDEANKHEWLIWDETGISLSSKNWYKLSNILVEDVIQTMRIKELGIIFITQNIGFIDNRARSLFRYFTEIERRTRHPPTMNWRTIKVDQKNGKVFFPFPRIALGGKYAKYRKTKLSGRLPEKIRKQFEDVHIVWKEKLMKRHKEIIGEIEKAEYGGTSLFDIIEQVQINPAKYSKEWRGKKYLDKNLIMLEFSIGRSKADQVTAFLRGKGVLKDNDK